MRSSLNKSLILLALAASIAAILAAPQLDISSSPSSDAAETIIDDSKDSDNIVVTEVKEEESGSSSGSGSSNNNRGGGGGLLAGIFNLITGGFRVAQDERIQNTVVNGVHVAMNATGEILKTGSQVLTAAPRAASRQANLLGGLVKVANESAPSISSRLDELDRFSKLFSTFVRSYQNVLVDNIETFQNTFNRRLRCHTECDTLTGEEREKCDELYCKYFNPEEFKFDDPPAPKDPDYDIEYDF